MFADNIDALRSIVLNRKRVLHQKQLDSRQWNVRRSVMRDVKDTFLPALESAIAKSHSDYGYSVVLRTYSNAEWEETDADYIKIAEVFSKTDVLKRVANCLAPGFFKCRVQPRAVSGRPAVHHLVRVYDIVARFYPDGIEPDKIPCTCVCSHLTNGFCGVCGGHNVKEDS